MANDVRLIKGDCLKVLPRLGKIDAIVADPPYGISHDTDYMRFSKGGGTARRGNFPGHSK